MGSPSRGRGQHPLNRGDGRRKAVAKKKTRNRGGKEYIIIIQKRSRPATERGEIATSVRKTAGTKLY